MPTNLLGNIKRIIRLLGTLTTKTRYRLIFELIASKIMKLYATTTSERASKGQGGNKKIKISIITGENREERLVFEIVNNEENYNKYGQLPYILNILDGDLSFLTHFKSKISFFLDMKKEKEIKDRLEYIRGELRAEKISYSELAELQILSKYIDKSDMELLEAAGVPEFKEEKGEKQKGEQPKKCNYCGYATASQNGFCGDACKSEHENWIG